MKRSAFATALFLGLAACGGSDSAEMEAPAESAAPAETEAMSGEMTMPAWYTMDGDNVTLDIVAGQTDKGNYWNYNGAQFGEMTITVPVGHGEPEIVHDRRRRGTWRNSRVFLLLIPAVWRRCRRWLFDLPKGVDLYTWGP